MDERLRDDANVLVLQALHDLRQAQQAIGALHALERGGALRRRRYLRGERDRKEGGSIYDVDASRLRGGATSFPLVVGGHLCAVPTRASARTWQTGPWVGHAARWQLLPQ